VLAINNRVSAAERDAAVEFLRFMTGEAAQRELLASDIQPARGDLALDGDSPQSVAARAFRGQAEQGLPMPNNIAHAIVWQELTLMQQHVLVGLASPSEAVAEADGRLREKLKLANP
jgi:maltose-binding protein MalE